MDIVLGIGFGIFLAYANGANDNFKGVATLFGSDTLKYKQALLLATVTTLLGSVVSIYLADTLLKAFQGKGLVAEATLLANGFILAVGGGSAMTVMLAARLGIPISTTHSLVGALTGTALVADPASLNINRLGGGYFMPLLVSPLLAILGTIILYPVFRMLRQRFNINRKSCVCIAGATVELQSMQPVFINSAAKNQQSFLSMSESLTVPMVFRREASCREVYNGKVIGLEAEPTLNFFHIVSGGVVSFARGLNDTPKIAAVMLAGSAISPAAALAGVAVFIALGGWFNSRKVAITMSQKVTKMNAGQGFTANIVSGFLIIGASKLGMPVSTTHVTVGSLFGLGAVTRKANWASVTKIALSWVATLPLAAILSGLMFLVLQSFT